MLSSDRLGAQLYQIQRHVGDHVLLPADHAAAA